MRRRNLRGEKGKSSPWFPLMIGKASAADDQDKARKAHRIGLMAAASMSMAKPRFRGAGPMACSVHGTAARPDQGQFLGLSLDQARIDRSGERGIVQLHREVGIAPRWTGRLLPCRPEPGVFSKQGGGKSGPFSVSPHDDRKELHRLDVEIEGLACEGASEAVVGTEESADR